MPSVSKANDVCDIFVHKQPKNSLESSSQLKPLSIWERVGPHARYVLQRGDEKVTMSNVSGVHGGAVLKGGYRPLNLVCRQACVSKATYVNQTFIYLSLFSLWNRTDFSAFNFSVPHIRGKQRLCDHPGCTLLRHVLREDNKSCF